MYNKNRVLSIIKQKSQAMAIVQGSEAFPDINGKVLFYQRKAGVVVVAQIFGLPKDTDRCSSPIFAFHIHAGGNCSGNEEDSFAQSMGHYNLQNCAHPYHAGDMPPLFGCGGYAFSAFFTDRFSVNEIIGRTVIIHSKPDDFTSQPSGNPGTKIACGVIKAQY